jgi:hypothetical protein
MNCGRIAPRKVGAGGTPTLSPQGFRGIDENWHGHC